MEIDYIKTVFRHLVYKLKKEKPNKIILRNVPKQISNNMRINLYSKLGIYHEVLNPDGDNFDHDYIRLKIKEDEIILDETTDLIWQQNGSQSCMLYANATEWINQLNQNKFAQLDDWRLPTLEEAMSLIERDIIYFYSFFDEKQDFLWTCDKVKGDFKARWVVDVEFGHCYEAYADDDNYVRAVRTIQPSDKF